MESGRVFSFLIVNVVTYIPNLMSVLSFACKKDNVSVS